jgi:hypothetical protein
MKVLVILIWLTDPIIMPLTKELTCYEQGNAMIEKISTYQPEEENPLTDQGWYTPDGHLVYGFYCE